MKKFDKLRETCEEVASYLKALSHPQRLIILSTLLEGEKTVSEIQEFCSLSQSQLSQFLGRLKLEGIVKSRREGQFVFYRIEDTRIKSLVLTLNKIFCSGSD